MLTYTNGMNHAAPECTFCVENGLLKGEVLAETEGGFVTAALGNPGCCLVTPKVHAETVAELPDGWWQDMKALVPKVVADSVPFNISLNYGRDAGQTVAHLHFWVIPRQSGLPASGKGFARLIAEADGNAPAAE